MAVMLATKSGSCLLPTAGRLVVVVVVVAAFAPVVHITPATLVALEHDPLATLTVQSSSLSSLPVQSTRWTTLVIVEAAKKSVVMALWA